jgi:hypothetical protein
MWEEEIRSEGIVRDGNRRGEEKKIDQRRRRVLGRKLEE